MGTRAAGHLCMVEPAPVRGRSLAETPWKELSAKFGGITIERFRNVVSHPRPRKTRPKRGGRGGDKARGVFRPLQKVSTNPYFILQVFSHFFSLSAVGAQSRAEGGRARVLGKRPPRARTLSELGDRAT
jgi:hypothetical protein